MTFQCWSSDEVEYRLNEAARTLRHMKLGGHAIPSTQVTYWPEVVRSAVEAYGWEEEKPKRGRPSAQAIDRMDQAIGWLLILTDDERRIVWARSERMPWAWMASVDEEGRLAKGRSTYLLKRIYSDALDKITAHVNAPYILQQIESVWSRGTAA